MQRGKLLVPVQHLTDEPFKVPLRCAAVDIGLEGFLGDVSVDVVARRVDQRILLKCEYHAQADSICDRCTDAFVEKVDGQFEQWYVVNPSPGMIEEDAYAIGPDQHDVHIDADVREHILIDLPMKRLCREDCQGLCPTCGKNRNLGSCSCEDQSENPLWAGLKRVNK